MRVWFDDGVGFETDKHDAELATAVRDTTKGVLSVVEAVGGGEKGACGQCGKHRRLREFLITLDGQLRNPKLCAACQQQRVEAAKANAGSAQPEPEAQTESEAPDGDDDAA